MHILTRAIISLIGFKTYSPRKKTCLLPEYRQIPIAKASVLGEEPIINSFLREENLHYYLSSLLSQDMFTVDNSLLLCSFFKKSKNVYSQEKYI